MEGLLVLVAALVGAVAFGLWRRRTDGRVTSQDARADDQLTPADLGAPLGERVTFVQFSSAFCQPCRANRQVLDHLARTDQGVVHVDIDAESNLDLVRRLGVTRTPTTFVLDTAGAVRHRAVGPLRLADARMVAAEVARS